MRLTGLAEVQHHLDLSSPIGLTPLYQRRLLRSGVECVLVAGYDSSIFA
jgi:hypothetical protein